jgi:hypothetical protein
MPRNSSGVYQLPAGNPVVSGQLVESVWANSTMSDIAQALTDSLDRFGRSTMAAPLLLNDGTVSAPGMAFGAESSTGLFRKSAKVLGVTVGGMEVATFTQGGVTFPKGIAGDLTISGDFKPAGDLALVDDKLVKWGDGSAFIKGNGATDLMTIGGAQVNLPAIARVNGATYGQLGVRDGGAYGGTGPSAGYDAIAIENNGGTGISILTPATSAAAICFGSPTSNIQGVVKYDHAVDQLSLWSGAAQRVTLSTTGFASTLPILAPVGTAAAPGYTFNGDTATGMYRPGANVLGFASAGIEKARFTASATWSEFLIGGTAALNASSGRGLLELNAATDAVIGLNLGGAKSSYIQANSLGISVGTLVAQPARIFTNGVEKTRVTEAAQSELLVGTAIPAFSFANRGTVEINGTSSSLLGLSIAGTAQGYVVASGSTVQLQHASGTVSLGIAGAQKLNVTNTTLFDVINNQELGWRDIPQMALNATWSRGCVAPFNINFAIGTQAANATYAIVNTGATALTITQSAPLVLHLAGTTLTGNRTLAPWGWCTVWYYSANVAFIMGNVS